MTYNIEITIILVVILMIKLNHVNKTAISMIAWKVL